MSSKACNESVRLVASYAELFPSSLRLEPFKPAKISRPINYGRGFSSFHLGDVHKVAQWMRMQADRLAEKYWSSFGEAPGQLVTSNSSICLSWARPDRPDAVRRGQPGRRKNGK